MKTLKINPTQLNIYLALAIVFSGLTINAQNKIMIGAASDLKFALDSIISVYTKQNPKAKIDVNYGSSGKLFEQICNDAPFDLFFSADISFPQKIKEKGFAISDVKTYGIGRIVIWSKKIDPRKKKMASLLDPTLKKIAIANPTHAPYGARAKESMIHFKIYEMVENKLVYGENISQTALFVTTSAADIGIVALSLALSPNMLKEKGEYYIIPEKSHKRLEQGYVVLKHAEGNEIANNFFNFVSTPTAIKILNHFGFSQK